MKIIGVGVDIVDNLRIKKSIKNKKFILRIYSKKEIEDPLSFQTSTVFPQTRHLL